LHEKKGQHRKKKGQPRKKKGAAGRLPLFWLDLAI
jgi:hypothetical protein